MLLRTLLGMIAGLFIVGLAFIFVHLPVAGGLDETDGQMTTGSSAAAYIALLAMTGFCASYGLGLGNVVRDGALDASRV
jgi:amino acid transporter